MKITPLFVIKRCMNKFLPFSRFFFLKIKNCPMLFKITKYQFHPSLTRKLDVKLQRFFFSIFKSFAFLRTNKSICLFGMLKWKSNCAFILKFINVSITLNWILEFSDETMIKNGLSCIFLSIAPLFFIGLLVTRNELRRIPDSNGLFLIIQNNFWVKLDQTLF